MTTGAEIYLGDNKVGEATDGSYQIKLLPGAHLLRIKLSGYEEAQRNLALSLAAREVTEEIPLTPVKFDGEFNDSFDPLIKGWSPNPPGQLQTAAPKGWQVTREALALINNSSIPHRPFNLYRDFTLVLNVRLTNNHGAAWVVRAQDWQTYYLFELNKTDKKLYCYVCRAGQCERKQSFVVLADLGETNASYRIFLEATGNLFKHTIATRNGMEQLGGIFQDDTFSYGGIGLRAINGAEMLVNEFFVKPQP